MISFVYNITYNICEKAVVNIVAVRVGDNGKCSMLTR
jgi:hypothetical protein